MAQIKKIERQVEIKCNADKMFDIWARNTPELSKICPDKFDKIELHEGDKCHALGSILSWTYVSPVDGKHECGKTMLEDIDEKGRSFTWKMIEGEIINKYYKTWREKIDIIPNGENCSIFKVNVFEYEKKCEDAPHPQVYLDFFLACVKDTDKHLCSA